MKILANLIQLIIWAVQDFFEFLPKLIGTLIVVGVVITLVVMFPILLLFVLLWVGAAMTQK